MARFLEDQIQNKIVTIKKFEREEQVEDGESERG